VIAGLESLDSVRPTASSANSQGSWIGPSLAVAAGP
jgi:hypothetical protein